MIFSLCIKLSAYKCFQMSVCNQIIYLLWTVARPSVVTTEGLDCGLYYEQNIKLFLDSPFHYKNCK